MTTLYLVPSSDDYSYSCRRPRSVPSSCPIAVPRRVGWNYAIPRLDLDACPTPSSSLQRRYAPRSRRYTQDELIEQALAQALGIDHRRRADEVERQLQLQRRAIEARQRQEYLERLEAARTYENERRRRIALEQQRRRLHRQEEAAALALGDLLASTLGALFEREESKATVLEAAAGARTEAASGTPKESVETEGAQAVPTSAPVREVLYTHPFGKVPSSDVDASSISVSFDGPSGSVTVSNLWDPEPTTASDDSTIGPYEVVDRPNSPTPSDGSRSSSSSTHSRARQTTVHDVDENGDEIEPVEEDEVMQPPAAASPAATKKVEKTVELPAGTDPRRVRADLTDDGFELWIEH